MTRVKIALQLLLKLKFRASVDEFYIAIWFYVNDKKINEARIDITSQIFDQNSYLRELFAMKIKDLIQELSKYDKDTEVLIDDWMYGYKKQLRKFALHYEEETYNYELGKWIKEPHIHINSY